MELRNALESPDPLAFESNLPVHQDGTCNGLQHYAALGGDRTGAQQVNLAVTERPSDVYTYVANMVENHIDIDIARGDPVAKHLKGKISRKVVKQTVRVLSFLHSVCVIYLASTQVMTTVYGKNFRSSGLVLLILIIVMPQGVTYVGARAQIERQLRERKDIDREMIWEASSYIAKIASKPSFS